MFSRFFIDRPIFAAVLSIMITLAGVIAIFRLPMAQYPPVAPPTVSVGCSYPGASAQVVAETVAVPIEEQVNGVENMLYMSSQCANDGSYRLDVVFKQGVDLNLAQVLVQNRVNLAIPLLPDVLKKSGVTTRKRSPDILMTVSVNSPDGRFDQLFLSNYCLTHVREELLRLPGISDIGLSGQRDYSMRIWVDPERLAARNMTAGDVVKALREQNVQVATGQIGQPPVQLGQPTQITLSTLGRLKEPEQFADVIIRSDASGRLVRIKDIGRVELGAKSQDVTCKLDGKPSIGLVIFQLPDANALEAAEQVHAKMAELAQDFPEGMIYEIQYDTTPYTRECITKVFESLRDAILLVAFVVLLFLQNWRSAVIPLIAVPVAIVGTFAVMAVAGFSFNNLTLFGLVLAIGIVVDDAIVVVEAVEHHIEQGLAPREATIKAMSQVSAPVIAVGLVLSAVFVPCAFISGITGQFFRQFALTIATSTIISTFNSLTLSPALAAVLLQERDKDTHEALPRVAFPALGGWLGYQFLSPWVAAWFETAVSLLPIEPSPRLLTAIDAVASLLAVAAAAFVGWRLVGPINQVMRWGFRRFDHGFRRTTVAYTRAVGMLLRVSVLVLVVYGGLLLLTGGVFAATPKGFIPTQDMGYLQVSVQLPDAASVERSRRVTDAVQKICLSTAGVNHTLAVSGSSFALSCNASYFGSMFVILKDFAERQKPGLNAAEIANTLKVRCLKEAPEAMVSVFPAPPLRGVGRTGGFRLMVEDRGDLGLQTLQEQADNLRDKAAQLCGGNGQPLLVMQPNVFRANAPQLYTDVNRLQCMTMGVPLADVFNTLQVYLGSLYVNDFNLFGRTWQVIVQADAKFRNDMEKVRQLKVRNSEGKMTPLGSLAEVREVNGPLILTRYNMYPAAAINGNTAMGVSSGQGIAMMERLADQELLSSMRCEWTEMAYLQLQAGNTAMAIFGLAVVMVFLVLAAQYESWSLPLAVILVVPMCLLSAVIGVNALPLLFFKLSGAHPFLQYVFGGPPPQTDINIFTQIGLVVLVGLASKNAILIVEFAKHQRESGVPCREAAMAACRLRLRPIIMTSMAFILGVFPLLISRGAGAEMRRTLGTAVFSGMLGVTLFGVFLTPVFFTVIDRLSGARWAQSRWVLRIRFWTLGILGLGFVRLLVPYLADRVRRKRPQQASPSLTDRDIQP
jgi:multidrug efflux pump subunit AcrB